MRRTQGLLSANSLFAKPWIWSFLGALLVWLAAITFTHGHGASGMVSAALSLAVLSTKSPGLLRTASAAGMIGSTVNPSSLPIRVSASVTCSALISSWRS